MIGELAALGSALAWALVSILLRSLQFHISALSLNGFRCLFAALVAVAVAFVAGSLGEIANFSAPVLTYLIVSVFIGVGLGDLLYFYGLKLVGVVRGLPLSNVYPIITAIIAATFLGEPLSLGRISGTLLVILGIILVMIPGRALRGPTKAGSGGKERLGIGLILAAATCWATATILLKLSLQDVDSLSAAAVRLAIAAPVLIGVAALGRGGLQVREYRGRQIAGVILAGIFTAMSSLLFLVSIQLTGAGKAATLVSTSPLFGAPISLLMGEKITWQVILGSLISVIGIGLVATT